MNRQILNGLRAALNLVVLVGLPLLSACGDSPSGPSPQLPQVFSITPARGPIAGGTAVRITGANFAGGATVAIGGVATTEVVVESSTSITAKTGAHVSGTADVVVTVAGKSGSLPAGFSYEAPSAPPVITSFTARGTRTNEPDLFADLGEEINVTVVVQDPDTPVSLLSYEWSAESGTFTGTGAAVKWKAPAAALTPSSVRLTVTVVDGPNRVPGTITVRLHDSVKEVGDMARQFLLDFSISEIAPEVVIRDFSTSARCAGERASELNDVIGNRRDYKINSYSVGAPTVTFAFGGKPCSFRRKDGDACATVPALWLSTKKATGAPERAEGTDWVAAVYEQSRWMLCASDFDGVLSLGSTFIR